MRKLSILVTSLALILALAPALAADQTPEPTAAVTPATPTAPTAEAGADGEPVDLEALLGLGEQKMFGCPYGSCDTGFDCRRNDDPVAYCPLGSIHTCFGSSGQGLCDGTCSCY